jgi:hypothetical protein
MTSTPTSASGIALRGSALAVPVLNVAAALALLISLLGPTWLNMGGKANVSFSNLRTATRPAAAPGLQHAYFGWLGWTLVVLVVVGLIAAFVVKHVAASAVVVVLSLVGVILTLGCVKQLDVEDPSGGFFTHFGWIRVGGYLHVVGFVLAIAACVIAQRGTRSDGSLT